MLWWSKGNLLSVLLNKVGFSISVFDRRRASHYTLVVSLRWGFVKLILKRWYLCINPFSDDPPTELRRLF